MVKLGVVLGGKMRKEESKPGRFEKKVYAVVLRAANIRMWSVFG